MATGLHTGEVRQRLAGGGRRGRPEPVRATRVRPGSAVSAPDMIGEETKVTNRIDLNADIAESFGRWNLGEDNELVKLVTTVNVACGWHAGDPSTMHRSV